MRLLPSPLAGRRGRLSHRSFTPHTVVAFPHPSRHHLMAADPRAGIHQKPQDSYHTHLRLRESNSMTKTSDQSQSYYRQGCTEPAVASSLTVKKLERRRELTRTNHRMVIVLVGLPGRGKSFIGRKLKTFLTFRGESCKIFNVGKYRRQAHHIELQRSHRDCPDTVDESSHATDQREEVGACDANFFDSANVEANKLREKVAKIALNDMLNWLDRDDAEDTDDDSKDDFTGEEQGGGTSTREATNARRPARSRSRIAIFDATNSTKARRDKILETCTLFQLRSQQHAIGVVFVESICDDAELLEENYRYKISTSPDFRGLSRDEALEDLRTRARKYEERYETIDDDSLSYIKIFNFSSKLMANQIYGRMAKVIVPALMAWHIGDRPIYLCRAGKTFGDNENTLDEMEGCSGFGCMNPLDVSCHSDRSCLSTLSSPGTTGKSHQRKRSQALSLGCQGSRFRDSLNEFVSREGIEFMNRRAHTLTGLMTGTSVTGTSTLITGVPSLHSPVENEADDENKKEEKETEEHDLPSFPCFVMTSTMPRAIQTAAKLPFDINEYSNLNPLDKGDFTGMELEEIKEQEPGWYEQLERDPFKTRFPGGECYQDLVNRLETTIVDMEQQVAPVVVVSHVSVIQCLLAYFRSSPVENCTTIEVPMHTVIKLSPLRGGGWHETHYQLLPDNCSDRCITGSEDDSVKVFGHPIWGDSIRMANAVA